MKYLWFVLVILAVACGQQTDTNNIRGARDGQDNDTGEISLPEFDAPVTNELKLPGAFEGTLYFVFEGDLYRAAFNGDPASVVVENIEPSSLQISPDHKTFIYTRSLDIYAFDIDSGTEYRLGGGGIFPPKIQSWSPDGNWLILSVGEAALIVTRRDGGQRLTINADGTPGVAYAGWLENNTILAYTDYTPENPMTLAPPEVYVIDPTTGERTDIEFVPDTFAFALTNISYLSTANTYLSENGFFNLRPTTIDGSAVSTMDRRVQLDIVVPFDLKDPPTVRRSAFLDSDACFTWEIVLRNPEPSLANMPTVVVEEYSARLTNLSIVPDGRFYFLRWNVPNCDRDQEPTVSLMHARSDFEVSLISDQLFATGSYSMNYPFEPIFFATVQPFAVSPDGNYVTWTEGQKLQLAETSTYKSKSLLVSTAGDFQAIFWLA
jgi:hypothetical protein